MSLIDSIIFGALQGATEFLPISSSGHLILLANFFQVEFPTIVFEVVVHLGTLISILFIFRSDIISIINKAKIKRDFQGFLQKPRGIEIPKCPIGVDFEVGPSWGDLNDYKV